MIDGYDSITIAHIPRDAGAVVCYSDRAFKNDGDARAQFPQLAARGRIIALAAVSEPPDSPLAGDGVDTEPGNIPPAAAARSLKDRIAAGHWRPVGYADLSDMRALIADLRSLGVSIPPPGPGRPVRLFSAHPTGWRHICGPATCGFPLEMDATQWWFSSIGNPGGPDLDKDVFRDDFFDAAIAPAPAPTPKPQVTEADMITAVVNQDGRVEVFVEKSDTGEVFHAYQQQTNGGWAGGQAGVRAAQWFSLGSPGK